MISAELATVKEMGVREGTAQPPGAHYTGPYITASDALAEWPVDVRVDNRGGRGNGVGSRWT